MGDEVSAAQLPALDGSPAARLRGRARGRAGWLLGAGVIAFAATIWIYLYMVKTHFHGWAMDPVDLRVYREGGFSVRHATRWYNPHVKAPLYSWHHTMLQFTYPPFAALVFTVISLPKMVLMKKLSAGIDVAAFLAAIWFTFGCMGYRRGAARIGATGLVAAAVFWIEPVQRVLFLGQIELVLLALILWDMSQQDRRWWKGAGIGLAAGLKLVPLIFIPYLLLTRRFRQAAVATGTFAATIAIGFVVLPGDSDEWWLHGLFLKGGRTGFVAWEGNQSLRGIITRFVGSVATAAPIWLVAAALTAAVGLLCAAVLDRYGHRMLGLLTCALTGLLVSPISWDHHWVWVIPAITVAVVYGVRAIRRPAGWAMLGLAALIGLIFGAWPGRLWGNPLDLGAFSRGLIWAPPNTDPTVYYKLGDRPSYVEYHWHGFQLLVGNLYVLTGIALLALLVVIAVHALRSGAGPGGGGGGQSGDAGSGSAPGPARAQPVRLATPET
ncbi:MAG TPA: glycosyltransferase 87 family protein [Streptosporangiaceae bacterium]|nr:glycosyltransferase 87 family protein [Streptosporangiaceae bacterium]